ncbi:MAG: GspH/FimT family pseudopilin [Gemmatimonadales bacterium]|nr:GspH/FimT family pseudopilin [Gemmatimonadales bacterium]
MAIGGLAAATVRPMQRGVTLPELVLTLIIVGLLLGIALPRLRHLADRLAVDRAAQEIVAAHRRARMTAILKSRVLELTIDADDLTLRPRGDTTRLWQARGPASTQVALAGPRRTLLFSPVGMTFGLSNASLRLARGTASRTIVLSRLGRIRIVP